METPQVPHADEVPKSPDLITEHHDNEKELTDSPVEYVDLASDHVTAKAWLVIFVRSHVTTLIPNP
jgi:hypothetical protein